MQTVLIATLINLIVIGLLLFRGLYLIWYDLKQVQSELIEIRLNLREIKINTDELN